MLLRETPGPRLASGLRRGTRIPGCPGELVTTAGRALWPSNTITAAVRGQGGLGISMANMPDPGTLLWICLDSPLR